MMDAAAYNAQVDEMIDAAQARIDSIARTWLVKVGDYLVIETRGPGNQKPEDTEYIATGILRMGYNWSEMEPPTETANWGAGAPSDDSYDGDLARAKLASQVAELPMRGRLVVWNDIAYGFIVHEGLGRHRLVGADPWTDRTRNVAGSLLQEAIAEAK